MTVQRLSNGHTPTVYPVRTTSSALDGGRSRSDAYPYRWRKLVAEAIAAGARCADCGTDRDLEGDHELPVSRGGLSARGNLVIRCRTHNRAKGNRLAPRTQLTLDSLSAQSRDAA